MNKISVIIPTYCEEKVIEKMYARLKKVEQTIKDKYNLEYIFVNDGSTDKTLEILISIANNDKEVKVVSLSRNFGHQSAIMAGLSKSSGQACVVIDADLQDPPELIPEMIDIWEKGIYVVYAKRSKRKGESFLKKISAKLFYKGISKLSNIKLVENVGDFRLIDRKVVDILLDLKEKNKYLRGLYSWIGFTQQEIVYQRQKRADGKTKYTLEKMLKLALDGVISFSSKPIKLVGILGIISVLIAIIIFGYSLISYFFFKASTITGWTSIITVVTFLGGIQLLSLWIISEYIGRIYDETKNRPEYIIEKTYNEETEVNK